MKLCMGCMNEIEDHLSTCPYCGFNETTLRQESYYLDPGTIVGGKYIVGRVLNYGGHTVSYLGMDAEHNRKVIVKEYLPSDFSTRSEGENEVTIYSGDGQTQFEQGLTNFLNEANRIQHLQDAEGIAKVYDCVAENETGYVVSEYVEGRTLKEILDGGKKYTAEEATAFIRKILMGLSDVHHMDIVHCDISPETIMVTNNGDIKLVDFGATRYVTTANSKSLSIILKRGYAPEEQYRSKGVRGPWTDVYALGAVMYRMITGIVPQESVERALSDELKEPSRMGISISKNTENALMNALNVYQKDRTPSAKLFLKELSSDNVKRIKVKQKNNKTGKIPIWAKGLVAGLACIVAAGGVYVLYHINAGKTSVESKTVMMPDLRNKTLEEANNEINDLNEKYGWELQLETEEYIFDLTKENNSVYSQSMDPGTVLSVTRTKDETEATNGDNMPEGLQKDADGKIKGTISLTLYSQEKLHYGDIAGMNAYALAQKLGINTEDETKFVQIEGESGTNYFDLASIETSEGVITSDKLNNEEDKKKEITYNDNIKINYYASDYFYWKKLPDFVNDYKLIDKVKDQQMYKRTNEKQKKGTPTKKASLKEGGIVDDGYYTIQTSGYVVGQIVDQTVASGETYDGSNPGDTLLSIKVISNVLDYTNKTVSEFVEELDMASFGLYSIMDQNGNGVEEDSDWKIYEVKVYEGNGIGGHTDTELKYYKAEPGSVQNGSNVFFDIRAKEPEPESEPAPTQKPNHTRPTPAPAPSPIPVPPSDNHNA